MVLLDKISGVLLILSVVLAPWMLGSTTNFGVSLLTALGMLIGINRLIGWFIVNKSTGVSLGRFFIHSGNGVLTIVSISVLILLIYVAVSVVNARSSLEYIFYPGSTLAAGVEVEYLDHIDWLPSTSDAKRTFKALLKYVSMSFVFWAARGWLLGISKKGTHEFAGGFFPTFRFELILWILSVNSAVLAFVGMLQRLDGCDKLLWIFDNHINGGQGGFGPFPYQSTAAQYFNLMWPVMLGFWWVLRRRNTGGRKLGRRLGGGAHVMVLVLTVLVGAAVVLTRSKGGAIVLCGLLFSVLCFFFNFHTASCFWQDDRFVSFGCHCRCGWIAWWQTFTRSLYACRLR